LYAAQEAGIKQLESALKNAEANVKTADTKIAELTVTLQRLEQQARSGSADALKKLFDELNNAGFDTSNYQKNIDGAR